MKSEYRYVKDFKVEGKPFRFLIDWSGQLILLNMTYISDGWGDVLPCESYRSVGARLGAKVYRETIKIAVNAIFSLKLKHFWYSTGCEEIRQSLYERLANRLSEKYGFYCYKSGGCFMFYKVNAS